MDALDPKSFEWTIEDDIRLYFKVLKYVHGRGTGIKVYPVTRPRYKRFCNRRLTLEQDLALCREVVATWGTDLPEPGVPVEYFFEKNLSCGPESFAGRNRPPSLVSALQRQPFAETATFYFVAK